MLHPPPQHKRALNKEQFEEKTLNYGGCFKDITTSTLIPDICCMRSKTISSDTEEVITYSETAPVGFPYVIVCNKFSLLTKLVHSNRIFWPSADHDPGVI